MKEQFEAAVNRVANKIKGIENVIDYNDAINFFIDKGIDLQNEAWEFDYANRKYEFSTAVLEALGVHEEDYSVLTAAHVKALEDIAANKRFKPERPEPPKKASKKKDNCIDIHIVISVDDLRKALEEGTNAN